MVHSGGGDQLCTIVHHIEQKDCTARLATGCVLYDCYIIKRALNRACVS